MSASTVDRAHRVVCFGKGGTDQLRYEDTEVRAPRSGEVLIRVAYAGVAFADTLVRRGVYPKVPPHPFVPGYDVAGTVAAVGDGVSSCAPGERVLAFLETFGGYAEYVVVPAALVVRVPDSVSSQSAVCLPLNYLSAHLMLHDLGKATPGERVVVTSAAGGVGTAVLELGRLAGLEMFGVVSSRKAAIVEALGATAIVHDRDDFVEDLGAAAPGGVDLFLDCLGGDTLSRVYPQLRENGRFIAYGALATGGFSSWGFLRDLARLYAKRLRFDGRRTMFNFGLPAKIKEDPAWYGRTLEGLLAHLEAEKVAPVVEAVIPLSEAARAQDLLESRCTRGKIILACGAA